MKRRQKIKINGTRFLKENKSQLLPKNWTASLTILKPVNKNLWGMDWTEEDVNNANFGIKLKDHKE